MALRHTIGDVTPVAEGIWRAKLTPAEVRRVGEGKTGIGETSVVSVERPYFEAATRLLSVDPATAVVLNVGKSDDTIFLELGGAESPNLSPPTTQGESLKEIEWYPAGVGDADFIKECETHLGVQLTQLARKLLVDVRRHYPGKLVEGTQRKWINKPTNFLAITIQNTKKQFAVSVYGEPNRFSPSSLELRPGWPSYTDFKLKDEAQLADAVKIILQAAQMKGSH